jgi:hypothetical protein
MAGEQTPDRWSYWNGPWPGGFNMNTTPPRPSPLNLPPNKAAGLVVEARDEVKNPTPAPKPVRLFASKDEYLEFFEDVIADATAEMQLVLPGILRRAVRKWARKKFGDYWEDK